jgi:hypothetical protein
VAKLAPGVQKSVSRASHFIRADEYICQKQNLLDARTAGNSSH